MKPNEAQDIVAIIAGAVKGDPTLQKRTFWEQQLERLDADQATQAALLGIRTWEFWPAWKDFATIFQSLSRLEEQEGEANQRREFLKGDRRSLPEWVKRWVCARYLYKRFDRDRDERPFREQAEYVDPLAELMPDNEWATEAATLTEGELWHVIQTISGEGSRGEGRPAVGGQSHA